jgi:nitrite reductase/ring-hydroxylating ferredoxin subunit
MAEGSSVVVCASSALQEQGSAVSFEVWIGGRAQRAFAVRYGGVAHAYLNRCTHVAIEMDAVPDRFFDLTGHWLMCSTHGAVYRPDTGQCAGGPCRGGLRKLATSESDGVVHWHPEAHVLNPPKVEPSP